MMAQRSVSLREATVGNDEVLLGSQKRRVSNSEFSVLAMVGVGRLSK
jgi:hypothetical protein